MPTGYTADVYDGVNNNFKDFVLRCTRGMGVCISMREDSLDTPIPEKFEPTGYHVNSIKQAEKELTRLMGLSPEEQLSVGQSMKDDAILVTQKVRASCEEKNKRLFDMLAKVKRWVPPTPNHTGLKTFMIEQLTISMDGTDYVSQELKHDIAKTPDEYYQEKVVSLKKTIRYHTEQHTQEVERAEKNTLWIKQLRDSLGKD